MCLARLALKAVFLIRVVVVDAVMATRVSSTTSHMFRMSKLISPIAKTRGVEGRGRIRNLQHKKETLNRQDESIDVQEKES